MSPGKAQMQPATTLPAGPLHWGTDTPVTHNSAVGSTGAYNNKKAREFWGAMESVVGEGRGRGSPLQHTFFVLHPVSRVAAVCSCVSGTHSAAAPPPAVVHNPGGSSAEFVLDAWQDLHRLSPLLNFTASSALGEGASGWTALALVAIDSSPHSPIPPSLPLPILHGSPPAPVHLLSFTDADMQPHVLDPADDPSLLGYFSTVTPPTELHGSDHLPAMGSDHLPAMLAREPKTTRSPREPSKWSPVAASIPKTAPTSVHAVPDTPSVPAEEKPTKSRSPHEPIQRTLKSPMAASVPKTAPTSVQCVHSVPDTPSKPAQEKPTKSRGPHEPIQQCHVVASNPKTPKTGTASAHSVTDLDTPSEPGLESGHGCDEPVMPKEWWSSCDGLTMAPSSFDAKAEKPATKVKARRPVNPEHAGIQKLMTQVVRRKGFHCFRVPDGKHCKVKGNHECKKSKFFQSLVAHLDPSTVDKVQCLSFRQEVTEALVHGMPGFPVAAPVGMRFNKQILGHLTKYRVALLDVAWGRAPWTASHTAVFADLFDMDVSSSADELRARVQMYLACPWDLTPDNTPMTGPESDASSFLSALVDALPEKPVEDGSAVN